MKSRQVDLLEGLVAQPQVDPVWGNCELESHGLVSFCHLYGLLDREEDHVTPWNILQDSCPY